MPQRCRRAVDRLEENVGKRRVADTRQHLLIRPPDGPGSDEIEDALGRPVKCRHHASCIRRDDAARNGGVNILHVGLHRGDFAHVIAQILEEPGIIDGDSRLIAEGGKQIEVRSVEERALGTAIHIDDAHRATAHP